MNRQILQRQKENGRKRQGQRRQGWVHGYADRQTVRECIERSESAASRSARPPAASGRGFTTPQPLMYGPAVQVLAKLYKCLRRSPARRFWTRFHDAATVDVRTRCTSACEAIQVPASLARPPLLDACSRRPPLRTDGGRTTGAEVRGGVRARRQARPRCTHTRTRAHAHARTRTRARTHART